jgi:hypothetical protein
VVEDPLLVDPLDAFQGERWAGTGPEQPLQTRAVVALDRHGGVQGDAAVVRPGAHVLGIVGVEETAAMGESSCAPAKTPSMTQR